MYSAKSPTTVGPASVSWARDLARATPVTWAGQLSSPQQQLHSYNADTHLPLQCTVLYVLITVSSSAERGIMCDKILGPDTLNVDMGDFV